MHGLELVEIQRHAEEIRKPHSSLSGSRQALQNTSKYKGQLTKVNEEVIWPRMEEKVTGEVSVHTQFADNMAHSIA